jgi:hypothetical protein
MAKAHRLGRSGDLDCDRATKAMSGVSHDPHQMLERRNIVPKRRRAFRLPGQPGYGS